MVVLSGSPSIGFSADPPVKIGMPQGMFRDVQPNMVQALSKPFRMLMERQAGIIGEVEILPDGLAMAKKIKDNQLQVGVFHGFEFAWAKSIYPDLEPVCVAVPQGRIVQACVVVHKDSPLGSLADLDCNDLIIPRGTKAHCLLFMQRSKIGLPNATNRSATSKMLLTPEEALNGVVSGNHTATLIDLAGFAGYQNLQPGAVKHLRILAKSEVFPLAVIAARKGSLSESATNRLKAGLIDANRAAQYKPLMMMWNIRGFEEMPGDYQAQLNAIVKAYPMPSIDPDVGTATVEK